MSYGRPEKQLTLKNLPESCLEQVELWVVPSQYKQYSRQPYASKLKSIECWPKHIDMVPKKRAWAMKNFTDQPYLLIDDDLSLAAWSQKHDRYLSPKDAPKLFTKRFLEDTAEVFEKYDGVSYCSKFMAEQYIRKENTLIKPDYIGWVMTGFSPEAPRDIKYNRVTDFTDFCLPMQVQLKSRKSCVYYGISYNFSQAEYLATTGTNSYRTSFTQADSVLKLCRMFPGIVTGAKDTGNKSGGLTLTKWLARAKGTVKEEHKQQSREYLESALEQYGLSRLPKMWEYPDDMPREDIFKQLRANWKEAKSDNQ